MNHIYRIVFNRTQQCYQAVAETVRGQGKTKAKTKASKLATNCHVEINPNLASAASKPILIKPIAFSVLLAFSAQLFSPLALAEPTGGQVTAGAGTISQAGAVTTINQATQNMAIDWHSFNIRANEAVRFNQPNANAIALNRVTGTESSSIMGSLTANGRVFILNPNGVLFGAGAQVNVGSLVASTASLSNANFMAGNFNFNGNGGIGNNASIVNNGNINIAEGGTLAFIAPVIKNNGTIIVNQSVASQGSVILAAADDVTLTLQNGGLTSYTLNKGSVQTLIDNGGLIQADGGHVVLTAKGLDALSQSAINHTGIIEAQTVSSINGKIELLGDMQIGALNVGGKLDASAPATKNPNGGDGGFVETSAAKVNIADSTFVTTKSDIGKTGTWLIDPTDFNINAGTGAQTSSSIGATTLSNNLRNNNVEIATVATGAGKGDIFVNSAVNWSSNLLTLSAHGDIQVNANLNGTGSAQLALESSGIGSYYYLNKGAKINLPNGFNFFLTAINIDDTIYRTDNFYVIDSIAELTSIRLNTFDFNGQLTHVNFALGSDLDLSSVDNFIPIGRTPSEGGNVYVYGGRFHGLGHQISNLSIHDASYDGIGLFASVSGEVKDLHLVDVDFRRNISIAAGGIAGFNAGSISSSSVSGNIEGNYDVGVGGLVGLNGGVISESYSTAEVISNTEGGAAGGLVGSNLAFINTSYATGAVGNAGYATGGLVGDNEETGNISNSYATGEVFGAVNAGGLAGNNDGSIESSYAIGRVTSTTSGGGLVDNYSEFGPATNSYWNTQTSNQTTSAGGTGKTTAQMQQQATYVGWDFDNVWRINEGTSYPVLRALTQGTIVINAQARDTAKVYDKTPWTGGVIDYSGFIDGDNVNALPLIGAIRWIGSAEGAVNVGEYDITPTGLSFGGEYAQKYDIQFNSGTLYITPRVLDIAVTRDFNGNATFNSGFTLINNRVVAGDVVNVTGSATVASANAGTYNSFVANNLVSSNPNYTANPVNTANFTYGSFGNVVARINPTLVNVTGLDVAAVDATKVYGVADPLLTYNYNRAQLFNGDLITGQLTREAGENVGNYDILQGTLTAGSNYNINFIPGNFSITPRPISVTGTKVYDGTTEVNLTNAVLNGVYASDRNDLFVANISGTLNDKDVGVRQLTNLNELFLTGDAAGNYVISQTGNNWVVSPLNVNVTALGVAADDKIKIYGNADPIFTYQLNAGQLLNGDTFTGQLTRESGENVGNYAIQQGTLTAGSNYTINFTDGNLSVTPRPLVVWGSDYKIEDGNPLPNFGYRVYDEITRSLTNNNLVESITFSDSAATKYNTIGWGTYPIEIANIQVNPNYSVTQQYNGTLLIEPQSVGWVFNGVDTLDSIRSNLNKNLPDYTQVASLGSPWILMLPAESIFHDDPINGLASNGGVAEQKFIHPDGREVVFYGDTYQMVTKYPYAGTYNFENYEGTFWSGLTHGFWDVITSGEVKDYYGKNGPATFGELALAGATTIVVDNSDAISDGVISFEEFMSNSQANFPEFFNISQEVVQNGYNATEVVANGIYDYVKTQGTLDVSNFIYTFTTTNKTSQYDLIGQIIDIQYQIGSLLNFAALPLDTSTQAAKLSVSHFVDVACIGICEDMASDFKETTNRLIEAVPKILALKDAGQVAEVTASNVTWLVKEKGMSYAEASLTVAKTILKQAASNQNPLAESHARSMIEAIITAKDTADYLIVAAQDALK